MFGNKYPAELPFAYASKYLCGVIPKGILDDREPGKCIMHKEADYTIFFRENIPEDIKQRFIKEYREYYLKKKKEQLNGIFRY